MLNRVLDSVTTFLEHRSFLDAPAEKLQGLLAPVFTRPGVRHLASGTPLGHALHPLLVTVPIGAWTSALMFDALGDEDAADVLVLAGLGSALPTAFTGLNDWSYTGGAERRIGLIHLTFNTLALSAYAASWVARRRGARGWGVLLSLAGMGAVGGGGWMGGHLSYAMGVGVDTTAFQHAEEEWTDLAPVAEVRAGVLTGADLDGVPLVVTRLSDRIVAYADRCSHRGAPLHEGTIEGGCIICPWHQSAFDLRDGTVSVGPASRPQPAYEVRVVGDRLEARRVDPRGLRTEPVGR